jgi:hypothetical protein
MFIKSLYVCHSNLELELRTSNSVTLAEEGQYDMVCKARVFCLGSAASQIAEVGKCNIFSIDFAISSIPEEKVALTDGVWL